MAPTWIETDTNTNVNISSATAVGVYTSTGDKFVMPQVLADQVAGNGDYVYYVTLQVAGAGSHYVIGPKTTHTAAASETAIGAQGGFIAVRSGDVVTVYIDGLAGDTAIPDVTVRWFELDASANVTKVKDASLTETGAGYLAAALSKLLDVAVPVLTAASVNQTGDSYARLGAPTGASVSADVAAVKAQTAAIEDDTQRLQTQVGTNGAGLTAIGDARLANLDATVSSRLASGSYTVPLDATATQAAAAAALAAYDPPTLAELTSAVAPLALEATAQAILEDTGTTLPALIGGLSGATVTVVSSVDGGTVTVYAADTWRFTVLSDQLALADYETLGLIVKRSARQADTQALLYLRSDTGLVRIGGAAPVSAGNGTLTKTATSFTAVVHVAETQGLVPGVYTWWLKGLDTTPAPDEAVTLATGEFVVLAAGLQAVG